jgi:hypothetical protein
LFLILIFATVMDFGCALLSFTVSLHNGALLFLILIFATVMDFGCALLSFTEGMHGGYCWRIMEADRV